MRTTRRDFLSSSTLASCSLLTAQAGRTLAADKPGFSLKYILGSCMYGYMELATILPEVAKTGSVALDIWPKVHGNQREQLDELGEERFAALLKKHQVPLGCITQYKLGPFGLQDEMRLAKRLGCHTLVTGAKGPHDLTGDALKAAVKAFVEQLKPHLEVAAETDMTIAIENHGKNLIESPDSLKWLSEFRPSKHLGVALAPYHLPQDTALLANLIRSLGDSLSVFYAWEHGMGCMTKMPEADELKQLPGRGTLDFAPLLAALRDITFDGWTEIFMHHTPRGEPILATAGAITAEINRARAYLEKGLQAL
jgi:sugar phosphate isomerase/epimerase